MKDFNYSPCDNKRSARALIDVVTTLTKEYNEEVKKRATEKGYAYTRYTIIAYGTKVS